MAPAQVVQVEVCLKRSLSRQFLLPVELAVFSVFVTIALVSSTAWSAWVLHALHYDLPAKLGNAVGMFLTAIIFPGMIAAMALADYTGGFSCGIASGVNALFYGVVGWVLASLCARCKAGQQ